MKFVGEDRLTQKRVRELLDYDPETGLLRWKVNRSNVAAGSVAGCEKRTYVMLSVDDTLYRAHRVIWLWMTGSWPKSFVDHKDLNKKNNAWGNLREATKSDNQANMPPSRANTSGLKGASRYRAGEKYGKPWQSSISKHGKTYHLGHFATAEQAHEAYMAAAERMFGEFARAA